MRLLAFSFVGCLASVAVAQPTYLGLYLQGSKIGYASYQSQPVVLSGKHLTRSDSRTVLETGLMGSSMSVTLDSTSWSDSDGKPVRMVFDTESGGRSNKVDAAFSKSSVVLDIVNGGIKTRRTLVLPTSARLVDDPLNLVLHGKVQAGMSRTFFVLDPSTASFVKSSVLIYGKAKTTLNGKPVSANHIRLSDSRSVTDVYVSLNGDVIRVDGPMGISMIPVSKKVALANVDGRKPTADLAIASSIKADRVIKEPDRLSHLSLRLITSSDADIPSDQFQTARKESGQWVLDIHPRQLATNPVSTISQASATKPEWIKPSLDIPSDSTRFKDLAAKIIGSKKIVQEAAFSIQEFVYQNMKPNAGIGVLRDATEVLDSKEGVCRDYAILTVTLLRAAGIPARLASGLVNWDGTFYYHAWAEAWDGAQWIGIDSVTDQQQISAAHVKLGEGNVDTAFAFTFLEKAKIEVLKASKE